jgi:hypothetical protein
LLFAIRYSHGRGSHPYQDCIAAVREVWATQADHDRRYWLDVVGEEVPRELSAMISRTSPERLVPISRCELEEEAAAYGRLFAWCSRRLGALAHWPCDRCDHLAADFTRGSGCDCSCHKLPDASLPFARSIWPEATWAALPHESGVIVTVTARQPTGATCDGEIVLQVHNGRFRVVVILGEERVWRIDRWVVSEQNGRIARRVIESLLERRAGYIGAYSPSVRKSWAAAALLVELTEPRP